MGKKTRVTHINFNKCDLCRRRKATLLCDMPKRVVKNLHITTRKKLLDGTYVTKTDYENSFKQTTLTCDTQICERCSVLVGDGVHFCRECISKLSKL